MVRSILRSKYFAPIVVVLIFWLGLVIIKTHNQRADVDSRVSDLEGKASDIERANRYIEKLLTYIKTPEFLDREARIRLNYMSSDEKVAYVYTDRNAKIEIQESAKDEGKTMNIFQKFWQWLTGK